MTSQVGKRTTAILAFIALAFSVIVPLSVPKAFSAPDCHRAEAGDYQAKIDKVVADFTAVIKDKGSYGYGVHNGRVYSPALDSIVPGFGEGREIDRIIEGSKYSLIDVLGEGAFGNGMSNAHPNEDGTTTSNGSFGVFSPKKTVDEAKLKEVITSELAKFLKEHPREICEPDKDEPVVEPTEPTTEPSTKPTGDNPKPGCKKGEVKDYATKIEKVVDEIEASKYEERVTGGETTGESKKSFLRIFTHYKWNTAILRQINPGITDRFVLTEEQTKQVFGDGAKPVLTAKGPAPVQDEQGNVSYPGEASETFHAKDVTKFDREALTKIIADKVAEFLAKNPQEICESDDIKPGTDPKPGCKKAEVKDYAAGIEKVVEDVSNPVGDDGGYLWSINQSLGTNRSVKITLDLTDEQVKQVFGDGAESSRSMTGPAIAIDENGKPYTTGGPTVYFGVNNATKFDRAAMTKIITDKVSEFLAKNPQEICEEGSDPKPGTTEPTGPGTDEPTTDPTKPGDNPKPGTTPAGDNKPGATATTDEDSNPASGAATSPEGEQTVLEGATEAGGLATTGAVGLIALGVSAVLIGAGAFVAIRRRKQDM